MELCTAVIEAGATTINLPDTVGYTLPDEYAGIFSPYPYPYQYPNPLAQPVSLILTLTLPLTLTRYAGIFAYCIANTKDSPKAVWYT